MNMLKQDQMMCSSILIRCELSKLYQEMHRAMTEGDVDALSSMLSNDFHLTHMTGYDQPKDEWLSHIKSGQMQYSRSIQNSVRVILEGEGKATLIGQNRVEANIWGVKGVWPLRLEIECAAQDGRWIMLSACASTY